MNHILEISPSKGRRVEFHPKHSPVAAGLSCFSPVVNPAPPSTHFDYQDKVRLMALKEKHSSDAVTNPSSPGLPRCSEHCSEPHRKNKQTKNNKKNELGYKVAELGGI